MRLFEALAEQYLGAIMPGIARLTFHADITFPIDAKIIKGEQASPEWFTIYPENGNTFEINTGTNVVFRSPGNDQLHVNANTDKSGQEVVTVTHGDSSLFYVRRKPYWGKFAGLPISVTRCRESEQI